MEETQIPQTEEPKGAFLPHQASPATRILVVDDEPDIRRLNTEALIRSGYEVDAAEDGEAAWEALMAENYDLLITDNRMPNLTGLELLQKLRAHRTVLPVIVATGTLPAPQFTCYPWLQPAAILLKPYTTEELLGTVIEVLQRASDGVSEPLAPPPARAALPCGDRLQM